MKIAILAGGLGERFAGVERRVPKPLAPIGGRPILWHIMKHYEAFGWNDFVIAIGHRGEEIRSYFANLASSGEVPNERQLQIRSINQWKLRNQ